MTVHIYDDTWESDAGPPVWKRLQKAEAKLATQLDAWHTGGTE